MEQEFTVTKAVGLGVNSGPGYPPNASWSNPNNITLDDGNSATIGFFEGGQDGDLLVGSQFDFDIPDEAVIDGVEVTIDGSNVGCWGSILLSVGGFKDASTLNTTYGGPTDLWDQAEILPADVNDTGFGISVALSDVSGGDGFASIDYVTIKIYYHIDVTTPPADVPTRVAYKVYSRDGSYLGELPAVTSRLKFTQDIGSAGASLDITCAKDLRNVTEVDALMTEGGDDLLTEDDLTIYAEITDLLVVTGNSEDEALFKNSNRIKAWLYNYWWPNGKLMFSGQVNRIDFSYGKQSDYVNVRVFSDGYDLANFIARGYPFSYTTDVTQSSQNGYVTVTQAGDKGAGWQRYGQTWRTGGSVTNVGAIVLKLQGTANVTLDIYDGPNGNFIGSVTRSVNNASAADVQFEYAQLLDVASSDEYFMAVRVDPGQSIRVYRHSTSSTYANGSMYSSSFSGGSGGGSYVADSGDFYFITKSGVPTTTATYSSDDPVTDMMAGILTDYNNRGGYVTERDFEATGLSLTYTFNMATIYDAMKKIIELSPTGYYAFIDLGTAEMDILPVSTTPDFYVVRGKDINELDIGLTIEQVKNYLLFSGGDTGGGSNLYRDYQDTESAANYGLRTEARSDNRVTLTNTANAIGETFIEEFADEAQETTITVLNKYIDITLLTPGKTIGFKNFGNFIDNIVVQIVRREYNPDSVTLTLGQLPVTMSAEVQRINRDLLNEQTVANPSAPS